MALIRPINKSNVVTVESILLTYSGTSLNVEAGKTYAIYITASGTVTVTGGEILSGAPSESTSGTFIIKATSSTLTISGAQDFNTRAAVFTGDIISAS